MCVYVCRAVRGRENGEVGAGQDMTSLDRKQLVRCVLSAEWEEEEHFL